MLKVARLIQWLSIIHCAVWVHQLRQRQVTQLRHEQRGFLGLEDAEKLHNMGVAEARPQLRLAVQLIDFLAVQCRAEELFHCDCATAV